MNTDAQDGEKNLITEESIKKLTPVQLIKSLSISAWIVIITSCIAIFKFGYWWGSKIDTEKTNKVDVQLVEILKQRIQNNTEKQKILNEIDNLIVFANNIYTKEGGSLRSAYVYVTPNMKELRNNTLILIESLRLKDTLLYKEIEKEIEIGPDPNFRDQFALKLKYIDVHIAALKSLRKLIKSVNFETVVSN